MSDNPQMNVAATPETASENAETSETEFTLENIKKAYFPPSELEAAEAYLNQCSDVTDLEMNFKPENGITEGYGLAIFPISKRGEGDEGNVVIGACAAEVPDFDMLVNHEKGAEFIRETVMDKLIAKVANAVRPRADGSKAGSIPHSITDFLESQRGRENIKAFTATAPTMVKVLRKRGIGFMHTGLLRQVLQSRQFAENQFPNIKQDTWLHVGQHMISLAKKDGIDPAVIQNWLDNRENEAAVEVEDDAIEKALADLGLAE